MTNDWLNLSVRIDLAFKSSEAEFKEFEPRLKYGWFYLKLYSIFKDLSRETIETGFWGFETRLKFIKFGHSSICFVDDKLRRKKSKFKLTLVP